MFEYCITLNRSEEEFLSSSIGKVMFFINEYRKENIRKMNFSISLVRSLGSRIPFIKVSNPNKKDVCVKLKSLDEIL